MKRFAYIMVFLSFLLSFCLFAQNSSAQSSLNGDVDADGYVTYDDAKLIFNYASGFGTLNFTQLRAADINGDGFVNVADAAQIFHYVSGLFSTLPFESRGDGRLTVATLPDKLQYSEGDNLDLSGLTVVIAYADGSSEPVTEYTVSGYDSSQGVKIIIVSYLGVRTAFTVTVYPKETSELFISALPRKTVYAPGEELDLTGLEVYAIYSDGTDSVIYDYAVDGFESTPGEHEITIFSSGKKATFTVTVKED